MDTAIELTIAIYNCRCNDIGVVRIGACNCDVFAYNLNTCTGVCAAVKENHVTFSGVIYSILNSQVSILTVGRHVQNSLDSSLELNTYIPAAVHGNTVGQAEECIIICAGPSEDPVVGVWYRP